MKKYFVLAIFLFLSFISIEGQSIEKEVLIPAPVGDDSRYFYIPFEVPKGIKSVSVEYAYDKKDGKNVLDLGLFDSGFDSTLKNVNGFRGWSGGRRNTVFVTEKSGTNGYLPRALPNGTWRIILGLYKVVPERVKVKIKVKFDDVDETILNQPKRESETAYDFPTIEKLPPAESFGGYKWFRGDLHIHTFHSDGIWTFPSIFEWSNRVGLDFIGLTDHNTSSHHEDVDAVSAKFKNILAMRGEEVTTYGGHFNVWGLPKGKLIDFRVTPKDSAKLQKSLDDVRQLGLIASINHPTAICGGCDWSYGDWTKMDSVEIWNGTWDFQDEAALKKWDELLQLGKFVAAIGSSDSHQPPSIPSEYQTNLGIGSPTTFVGAKLLSQKEILTAIKSGRVWISEKPIRSSIFFSAKSGSKNAGIGDKFDIVKNKIEINAEFRGFALGSRIILVSNGENQYSGIIESDKFEFTKQFDVKQNSYFRLEIRDDKGKMIAMTNPIFANIK